MINIQGNGYDIDIHGEQVNVPVVTKSTKNIHITMDGDIVTTVKDDLLGLGVVPHWGKYIFTFQGLCTTTVTSLIAFIKANGFDEFQLTSDVTGVTEARFVGNIFEILQELRLGGGHVSLEVETKDANSPGLPPDTYITEDGIILITEDVGADIFITE